MLAPTPRGRSLFDLRVRLLVVCCCEGLKADHMGLLGQPWLHVFTVWHAFSPGSCVLREARAFELSIRTARKELGRFAKDLRLGLFCNCSWA